MPRAQLLAGRFVVQDRFHWFVAGLQFFKGCLPFRVRFGSPAALPRSFLPRNQARESMVGLDQCLFQLVEEYEGHIEPEGEVREVSIGMKDPAGWLQ